MKALDPALASHIAQTVTTLAVCWKVARLDGTVMGFTTHDLDLTFDGVTYHAASGFTATEIETQLGLAVSNLEAQGALSSDAITENDLSAGKYDNAAVTVYRVNWADVSQRDVVRAGWIGQVVRGKTYFSSELRGLTSPLDQTVGRTCTRTCPWKLGDDRCTVDLTAAGRHGSGAITSINSAFQFDVSGLASFSSNEFSYGLITWTSGANAGQTMDVMSSLLTGSDTLLTLMIPMGQPLAVGDSFTIVVGCDRKFTTCVDKFANGINFGGFPDMPGNDYAAGYAVQGASS